MTRKRIDPISSVITVGGGRGFVVMTRHVRLINDQRTGEWRSRKSRRPLIITAAHCLPSFPPCHGASYIQERTYQNLIGPLGESPSVWAECLFADPIADIAVLGEPDGQVWYDECNAYCALIEPAPGLRMSDPKENTSSAWLLSLDREWLRCDVVHNGGQWHILNAEKPGIQSGMSGSPILNRDRTAAIGVLCLSGGTGPDAGATEGGPNPRLATNLPGWMAPRAAPITAPTWSIEPPQLQAAIEAFGLSDTVPDHDETKASAPKNTRKPSRPNRRV